MADLASAYLAKQKQNINSNALAFVLKAFEKVNSRAKLEEDDKRDLNILIKQSSSNNRTLLEVYQSKLWKS